MTDVERPRVGLVLAGAAALGAYEVGVVAYVIEELGRELGMPTMPTVLSGTSAGGINASALAAFADVPLEGVRQLSDAWRELHLDRAVRPSSIELLSMFLDVSGAPVRLRRALRALSIRGGILDPAPIAKEIERAPLARIGEHVRAGLVAGVAVSATRVANGEAIVFYDGLETRPWAQHEPVTPVRTTLTREHVLASAAIPVLFPTVEIDGELYCDGGLRQMVPLAPALHFGATRLLVVNPLAAPPATAGEGGQARANQLPATTLTSPLYLAGKAVNALFADRVEIDLARLEHTSAMLRAGKRRFGDDFERSINEELAVEGYGPLADVRAVRIEPTQDLGKLAAEYVVSRTFDERSNGAAGRLLRWLADDDPDRAGDLLGYLIFDGGFTAQLIELGRADARARHAELAALFA